MGPFPFFTSLVCGGDVVKRVDSTVDYNQRILGTETLPFLVSVSLLKWNQCVPFVAHI